MYRLYYLQKMEESLKNSKSDDVVIYEAAEIIKERDCKQFVEWYKDNIDHIGVLDSIDVMDAINDRVDLELYSIYCKDPDTVLDENGIDIEENWSYYSKWDNR